MMNRILFTLRNIFRASNAGIIAFFILNMFLVVGIFASIVGGDPGSIAMLVIIYLISVVIAFTPVGQSVLCLMNGARRMSRQDMRDMVLPLVERVYEEAKMKTPELPDRINVKVMYDPEPNAFAIGTNTICVTEGLLSMPSDLIEGILAHEMGHLAYQHTVIQLMIGGGNIFMTVLMLILQLFQAIATGVTVEGVRRDGAGCVVAIFSAICTGIVFLWTKVCMLFLLGSSRANEFQADAYAYEIGYGDSLAEALDTLTMGVPHGSFFAVLNSTHPDPADRIAKLQELGARYSRY